MRNARSLIAAFVEFLKLEAAGGDVAPRTIENYLSALRVYFRFCTQHHFDPVTASAEHVRLFRKWLVDQGVSRATVYNRLVAARRFYDSVIWSGARPDNPARGIKAPPLERRPADRIRYLTVADLGRLLSSLGNRLPGLRDRCIIALMGLHGLRSCEVRRATIDDLELPLKRLLVRGKNAHRYVYLRDDVLNMLQTYLGERRAAGLNGRWLFVVLHTGRGLGERMKRHTMEEMIKRAYKKAELPYSGTHILRHTAATLSLSHGASVEQVRDMLGHASIATTSVYVHAIDRAERNPASLIRI